MMAFFLSHYEKVILACLLVIFAILLIWQVNFLQAVQSQRVDAIINKADPASDQAPFDFSQDRFKNSTIFAEAVRWNYAGKSNDFAKNGNEEDGPKTDLFSAYNLSVCPFCFNLIPSSCFPEIGSTGQVDCPICKSPLKARQKKIDRKNADLDFSAGPGGNDRNNNGVPDDWERDNKVFSESAAVIDEDPDGDNYSSYQEYVLKTNPLDSKSHPRYITFTTMRQLARTRIPDFYFRGLAAVGVKDKEKMEFNIEHKENGWRSSRTRPKKFGPGGKFKHGAWTFEIVDVVPDDPLSPGQGTVIYVRRDGFNEKIKCEPNKPVYDPVETVVLYCAPLKRRIPCQVGKNFKLGDAKTGIEEYTIESATPESAVLVDAKGVKINVGKNLKDPLPKRTQGQEPAPEVKDNNRSSGDFAPIGGNSSRGKKNSRRK